MTFVGKKGICNKCNKETLIVCKGLCKFCYMYKWNNRKDIKRRKQRWEKENKRTRKIYVEKNWIRLKLRRAEKLMIIRTGKFIPMNLLREVLERDNYTCQYCGTKRDLSFDHKIPISKGGKTTKENLIIACMTCNAYKSDMDVREFRKKYNLEMPIRKN